MPAFNKSCLIPAAVGLMALGMTAPVYAGFEWIPPANTASAPATAGVGGELAMPAVPAPVVGNVIPPLDILTPMPGDNPPELRRVRPPFADGVDTAYAPPPAPVDDGMPAGMQGGGTLADAMPPSRLNDGAQAPPQRIAVIPRTHRDGPQTGERPLGAFWGSFFKTRNQPPAGDAPADAPNPVGIAPLALSTGSSSPAGMDLRSAPDLKNHSFVIDGFGEGMPLSVAASQLVLSPYQVRLDPSVDPATPISWSGGRAWHATLADALDGVGLAARVEGTTITILPASALPASPAPMPVPIAIGSGMMEMDTGFESMDAAFPPRTGYPTYGLHTTDTQPLSFADIPHPWDSGSPAAAGGAMLTPLATASWQSIRRWNGNAGVSADSQVMDWARQAGVEVVWQTDARPVLQRPLSVEGTLIDAINAVLAERSDHPLRAELFTNTPTGQPLLVVR